LIINVRKDVLRTALSVKILVRHVLQDLWLMLKVFAVCAPVDVIPALLICLNAIRARQGTYMIITHVKKNVCLFVFHVMNPVLSASQAIYSALDLVFLVSTLAHLASVI
jgi:hypothetical protein